VGLTHRFQVDSESRISSSVEYDYFLRGQQQSDLSDVAPGLNNQENHQNHGYGLRATLAYERKDWSVGVFYDYWKISDSEISNIANYGVPIGQGLEPKNTTDEYGVQVKYRF
jgi:predicted porin